MTTNGTQQWRDCAHCGETSIPPDADERRLYCDDVCKSRANQAAHRQRQRERKAAQREQRGSGRECGNREASNKCQNHAHYERAMDRWTEEAFSEGWWKPELLVTGVCGVLIDPSGND